MKKKLIVGEDLDGFLGYDPDAIDLIDIEASKNKYVEMLSSRILEFYPDIVIEFDWGGDPYYEDFENPYEVQLDLQMLEELVYNSGEFWVYKNEQ